jgi:hypothetical protein
MSIRSALGPVLRPFASALIVGKRGAKLADVGFAGVIVGAGGALAGGAAATHGRLQATLLWVGSILAVLAMALATIAVLRKEPARKAQDQGVVNDHGRDPTDEEWAGDESKSDKDNDDLAKIFRPQRARSTGANGPADQISDEGRMGP